MNLTRETPAKFKRQGEPRRCKLPPHGFRGKPYQTAVSLLSLMQHSNHHIDKIYFIFERKQPFDLSAKDFDFLKYKIGDKLIEYIPRFYLGYFPVLKMFYPFIKSQSFRHSIRYQYAWEKTDRKFLFITHNDILYRSDIVGSFLGKIGDNIAIGEIGQCWNCPAFELGICSRDNYHSYRPKFSEFVAIFKKYPQKRKVFEKYSSRKQLWPLPECRVNEWSCMINMELVRHLTVPFGAALPFGLMRQDIGTKWFYDIHQEGLLAKHFDLSDLAEHGWATGNEGGHFTLSHREAYLKAEQMAKSYLEIEHPTVFAGM